MQLDMKSTQLGGIANLALLAHVKSSFVPGAETFTYAERLETLFKTLNAIRLVTRESTISKSPFPDALGRWGILHSFRYALIPPDIGDNEDPKARAAALAVGNYRLYLSVTFDGGWEPYIRVIYRDLGSLLDTIFTNCVGYPLSRGCSFDTYTRWVRSREIPAGIFYTESPKSVLDERYLEAVERIQRDSSDLREARKEIAAFALPPALDVPAALLKLAEADSATQVETVYNNFKALKALYDLRALYATRHDGDTLLRFTVGALPEFRAYLAKYHEDKEFPGYKDIAAREDLVDWILIDPKSVKDAEKVREPADRTKNDIQIGVLSGYNGVTHGALFLLAIDDLKKARTFLSELPLSTENSPPAADKPYCNVAFTRQGLEALQAPQECLGALPQEFVEGMEARAGMLGDISGNHPQHWKRPLFAAREVELGSVHVVLQYRIADAKAPPDKLHPLLEDMRTRLATGTDGLRLLSTEAMRSAPTADGHSVESFGFKDGYSQPDAKAGGATGTKWDDGVTLGELVLGHANDRGDGPFPAKANACLDNGSFLVVRKIKQDVTAWTEMLTNAAKANHAEFDSLPAQQKSEAMGQIAAKLVGRDQEGRPLANPDATNDFNYDDDLTGSRCPFQAHVRRANPRRLINGKGPLRGRSNATTSLSLPGGRWTAHDLRRTAATFMAALGVSGDVIDECLNHVIESRVRRTYIRDRRMVQQRQAFDALGKLLDGLVQASSPTSSPSTRPLSALAGRFTLPRGASTEAQFPWS
jgi:hypothetical protein